MRRKLTDIARGGGVKNAIKRFPRLPNESEAVGLANLAWSTPQFLARMKTKKHAVDFIFRVSVPQFHKHYRALRSLMFPSTTESWEKAFQAAYSKSKYGDKDLPNFMANPLHELFRAGMKEWLDETWNLGASAAKAKLEAFNKGSRIRRHQPDPKVALWVARRRNRLLPAATRLRDQLKSRISDMKTEALRREVSKVLPYAGFLIALRRCLDDPTAGPRQFFNESGLSPKMVIEEMLAYELEKKGHNLRRNSVRTYLKVGQELINCLSSLPKPLL